MTQMTIQQAFTVAAQHHQAGRMREAEIMLRQILAQQPNHVDALNLLGVMAAQAGRFEMAVELIRKALALNPNMPVVQSNLGNVLHDSGDQDAAIAAYHKALEIDPNYAEAHYNLGNALRTKGDMDAAIVAFERAIALKPNLAEAYGNLGIALWEKGQMDAAVAACQKAIALKPNFPAAYSNLGCALKTQGKTDEAIAAYRQAIALNPHFAPAYCNLGTELCDKGEPEQALAICRQALAINPHYAEAHNSLGTALWDAGQRDQAIAAYRQAIALKPNYVEAYCNLGIALKETGHLAEANATYRQAIALKPYYAEAHYNLGNVLRDDGCLDEALASYRTAVKLKPDLVGADCNLVYSLYFHPDYSMQAIYQEHRRWDQTHAQPLAKLIQPHTNNRDPERRLKIGYVSPDFREHCQSFFTIPLLGNHDHKNFQIYCYSGVPRGDALTGRLQRYADVWRSSIGLTDEQLAGQIRQDQIDILVDLTMHMGLARPLVFARKPAPVQVCWLAYPGTTGMSAIDYRLSDPYLDPPGQFDGCYSEQTIRLPHSFWCYEPLEGRLIDINPLPAREIGKGQAVEHITFGCLNNPCKINPAVLRLWVPVLQALPTSRLLLLSLEDHHRQATLQLLQDHGIAPSRIEFIPRQKRAAYLELYHRIDLGLDSVPYNGHTTSLDSFWMGVPVVTLVGQTVVGRAGLCQLMNLNLPELIAHTPEQFVQIAVALAQDRTRLAELRRTLRQRMEQSPLMDAPRFARDVEAAYRQMWRKWCGTTPSTDDGVQA